MANGPAYQVCGTRGSQLFHDFGPVRADRLGTEKKFPGNFRSFQTQTEEAKYLRLPGRKMRLFFAARDIAHLQDQSFSHLGADKTLAGKGSAYGAQQMARGRVSAKVGRDTLSDH